MKWWLIWVIIIAHVAVATAHPAKVVVPIPIDSEVTDFELVLYCRSRPNPGEQLCSKGFSCYSDERWGMVRDFCFEVQNQSIFDKATLPWLGQAAVFCNDLRPGTPWTQ